MHRTLHKLILFSGIISILSINQVAHADTVVGRYLNVANQPLTSQADLLSQVFQVRFPGAIVTVGDAMKYLLRFSSYSLNPENPTEVTIMLSKPLPEADRNLGPMSLQDGLLTLAGAPYGLLIDPVHRLVSFRLLPAYKTIFHSK